MSTIKTTLGAIRSQTGGSAPWCGPTAVSYVTGMTYQEAEEAIRQAALARGFRYPAKMTSTYWQDVVRAAGQARTGAAHEGGTHGSTGANPWGRAACPTVTSWSRRVSPGYYLVRVTNHFAVLHVTRTIRGRTYVGVYDSVQDGDLLSSKRRRGAVFSSRSRLTHAIPVKA